MAARANGDESIRKVMLDNGWTIGMLAQNRGWFIEIGPWEKYRCGTTIASRVLARNPRRVSFM